MNSSFLSRSSFAYIPERTRIADRLLRAPQKYLLMPSLFYLLFLFIVPFNSLAEPPSWIASYPEVLNAEIAMDAGQHEKAITLFQQFLTTHSTAGAEQQRYVRNRLAKLCATVERYDEAFTLYEQLLQDSQLPVAEKINLLYERAKYRQYSGDVDHAYKEYEEIVSTYEKIHPLEWGVYWSKARLAAIDGKCGRKEPAIHTFEEIISNEQLVKSLRSNPAEMGALLLFIATDLNKLHEYERAASVCKLLLAEKPRWEVIHTDKLLLAEVELGRARGLAGKKDEALNVWNELFNRDRYLQLAPYVDMPAILKRLTPTEREQLGLRDRLEIFEQQIHEAETTIHVVSRRNIDVIYPDCNKGLEKVQPDNGVCDK